MKKIIFLLFSVILNSMLLFQSFGYGNNKSKASNISSIPTYEFNLVDSSISYRREINFPILTPSFKYYYTYNSNNLITTRESFNFNSNSLTWISSEVDSFFYNSTNKLILIAYYGWSAQKLVKGQNDYYNRDINDSLISYVSFQVDSLGNNFPYAAFSSNMVYYPSKLSVCHNDTMCPSCPNAWLSNYDSMVYNSNGTISKSFSSTEYYGFYGSLNNGNSSYKDYYSYNQNQQVTSILNQQLSISQLFKWDTMNKVVFEYYNWGKIRYNEYWDPTLLIWANRNLDSLVEYSPKLDRFNNVLMKQSYNWIQRSFDRFDSINYFYHIPSCLSYYTTKYDTIANTFNLTIDSASIAQAVGYSWDFGDGTTSNLQFPSHHFAFDTTYNVCLKIYKSNGDSCTYCHLIGKDYQGHIIKSSGFNLNVKGNGNIGINESSNSKNEIIIYPNPASQSIVISNKSLVNTIEITNVLGQIVLAVAPSPLDRAGVRSINIETLPNGIYFLKATDEKGNVMNAKFVKE